MVGVLELKEGRGRRPELDWRYIRDLRCLGAEIPVRAGLRERAIIGLHALKNAANPILTQIGISVAHLMGGTVVMEKLFNIPGLGRLAFDSVTRRDYPTIQGHILFVAVIYVFVNLAVDLLYKVFDPRIKYG